MAESRASPHERAAEAFARRARERHGDEIAAVLLYGSVARGEERGVNSDVDLLVVLSDAVDAVEVEEQVRDLAYDIELDRGVILSLTVKTESEYEQQKDRPFFRHVRRDAEVLWVMRPLTRRRAS